MSMPITASPTNILDLVAIAEATRDLIDKPNVRAAIAALDPAPLAVITTSLARLGAGTLADAPATTTGATTAPASEGVPGGEHFGVDSEEAPTPAAIDETRIPDHIIEDRNACAAALAAAGFTSVTLSFSGCGDEGHLDDISTEPDGITLTNDMHTMLNDFGEAYMEASGINWYDSEGGGGTLTFNLVDKTFSADVYWNETVSETGFAEEDVPLQTERICPVCKGSDPACQWAGIPANCSIWGKNYDTSA